MPSSDSLRLQALETIISFLFPSDVAKTLCFSRKLLDISERTDLLQRYINSLKSVEQKKPSHFVDNIAPYICDLFEHYGNSFHIAINLEDSTEEKFASHLRTKLSSSYKIYPDKFCLLQLIYEMLIVSLNPKLKKKKKPKIKNVFFIIFFFFLVFFQIQKYCDDKDCNGGCGYYFTDISILPACIHHLLHQILSQYYYFKEEDQVIKLLKKETISKQGIRI